jgi:glycogen debranching enzyme
MPLSLESPKRSRPTTGGHRCRFPQWIVTTRAGGASSFWRGDVWPVPNYQVAAAFAKQGHHDIAADIADKTVPNALVNGVNDHYDSVTGKPLGVGKLGMSSAIVTMMLDQLTSKYHLRVKTTNRA